MKHLICITTHKRDNYLLHLLNAIKNQFHDYLVLVFQDGAGDYDKSLQYANKMPLKWYKWGQPHGKKEFYKVHNEMFSKIQEHKFELCHMIQDDCMIVPEYLSTVNLIMANINIEVLNTLSLQCQLRQFFRQPEIININGYGVYCLQRLDCNYVAKRSFFERLDWKQIPISENYDFRNGSGVGSHTTLRYISNDGKIYNVLPSLIEHLGVQSVIGNTSIDYAKEKSVLKDSKEYK